MTISSAVIALFATLRALGRRFVRKPRQRPCLIRRVVAFRSIVRALWRQFAAQVVYAYSVGEWVFAPVRFAYRQRGGMEVVARVPAQIEARWNEGGVNWYRVRQHPWALMETELSKYERVIARAGWATAAA